MIDKHDIQGLIKQGYGYLDFGCYILAEIQSPPAFKQWLQNNISLITTAATDKPNRVMNIALTHSGMKKLELPDSSLQTFSREWQESMVTPERSSRLGDTQHNSPDKWAWGAPHNPTTDLLLCGFFDTSKACKEWLADMENLEWLKPLHILHSNTLPQSKEHFGFRDGVSQPAIAGLHKNTDAINTLKPGEFVLGHKNEYGETAKCPVVDTQLDQHLQLKADKGGQSLLGHNGTYLVFRQLAQDVKAFWNYVDQQSKDEHNKSHPQSRLLYAAKMIGRWPNGKILKPGATAQPSTGIAHAPENRFTFEDDQQGLGCPIGSHIRRSNPRGTLAGQSKIKDAIATNNRHRIIRRGRAYGPPLSRSMTPEGFLQAENTEEKRGLLFICLNSDIARQFEFVQQTWLNNSKFRGLYSEVDPIAGVKHDKLLHTGNHFTIPGKPFRQRLRQVPPFIKVRGGAYFFMPSIKALKFLSTFKVE